MPRGPLLVCVPGVKRCRVPNTLDHSANMEGMYEMSKKEQGGESG